MAIETSERGTVPAEPGDAAGLVRVGDRDRYIATLCAPARVRSALFALHAYDLALGEVVGAASEPQIGMIRLAWWRDTVRELRERPVRGEPVLAALGAADIDPEALAQLAEAHMDVLDGGGAGESGARLFAIAAGILGHADAAVEEAGRFWAMAGAVRRGVETETRPEALDGRFAAEVRPITALAAVARRDARRIREPRGTAGRQFAILRHILTGRT